MKSKTAQRERERECNVKSIPCVGDWDCDCEAGAEGEEGL